MNASNYAASDEQGPTATTSVQPEVSVTTRVPAWMKVLTMVSLCVAIASTVIAVSSFGLVGQLQERESELVEQLSQADAEDASADDTQDETDSGTMVISVAQTPILADGRVRINAVNAQTNTYGQQFVLTQDDVTLYTSDVIAPGDTIEWCDAADAHEGDATLSVQAIDIATGDPVGQAQTIGLSLVTDDSAASDDTSDASSGDVASDATTSSEGVDDSSDDGNTGLTDTSDDAVTPTTAVE